MSQPVQFIKLPVEVLRAVARMLLDSDLPFVGARGLLLQDSYLERLRTWRSSHVQDIPCTPLSCCDSPNGARSGQASTCFFCDAGPSRSAFDLVAVCRHLREVVLEDALFWGDALLLRPPQLPEAFDRARSIAEPRLSFVAQGGSCLHVLEFLLEGLHMTKRVELALPSTDMQSKHSPSKWIRDALCEGAPILEDVELRFDCAHAYEDAAKKTIILLPAIRCSRLLNPTFAIAGDHLTKLFMAAEQDSFRWVRADIFELLRLCPRLQVLCLQMVLLQFDTLTPARRAAYRAAGVVDLNDLRYFHISDKRLEWVIARSNIHTDLDCRMHPDILVSMRGDPSILAESCNDCAQGPNLVAIGRLHPFMALRIKIHTCEPWASGWPEYLSLSFGVDVESAMSFRDPISMGSAGSFTVRNATLSLQPVDLRSLVPPSDRLTLSTAMRGFLHGCQPLAIDEIYEGS